jgi:hypothetical protein
VARYKHLSLDGIIREMTSCNATFYSVPHLFRRVCGSFWHRRKPWISLAGNLSYRGNLRRAAEAYANFKRQWGDMLDLAMVLHVRSCRSDARIKGRVLVHLWWRHLIHQCQAAAGESSFESATQMHTAGCAVQTHSDQLAIVHAKIVTFKNPAVLVLPLWNCERWPMRTFTPVGERYFNLSQDRERDPAAIYFYGPQEVQNNYFEKFHATPRF